MTKYIQASFHFIRILITALVILISPLGWFYIICIPFAIFKSRYAFVQLHVADVMIASKIYGTQYRTISGIVGQKTFESNKKHWVIMSKTIDKLAEMCGDSEKHCIRAYYWELENLHNIAGAKL